MSKLNVENRTLYHGDNLDFLREINSNSIHLIATDPPFNKNRDFHATPDSLADGASFQDRWSWDRDVHQEWVDKITDDFPKLMEAIESARYAHSDGMGAYMCFMAVRLLEMKRILREDGSIYLHCDPTASHYLKAIMDAVFGHKNFRNEIIWCYRQGGRSSKEFARKHDIIFWYSKGKNWVFNADRTRVPYRGTGGYQTSGRGVTRKDTGKTYMPHKDGKIPEDWWDIPAIPPMSKERYGYPTQKPIQLFDRIVKVGSNPNDIVLDPFCGCATTLVAAERLKRQWVGADIWAGAHDAVLHRFKQEQLVTPDEEWGEWLITQGTITYTRELPVRTDDGEEAVPFLKTKLKVDEPKGEKRTRAEMYEFLLDQYGQKCQGCDREFDDPRYLELDHNTPRSDGGLNHISNRVLLCGPCNKLKSNIYTLAGLRRQNKKLEFMVDSR